MLPPWVRDHCIWPWMSWDQWDDAISSCVPLFTFVRIVLYCSLVSLHEVCHILTSLISLVIHVDNLEYHSSQVTQNTKTIINLESVISILTLPPVEINEMMRWDDVIYQHNVTHREIVIKSLWMTSPSAGIIWDQVQRKRTWHWDHIIYIWINRH